MSPLQAYKTLPQPELSQFVDRFRAERLAAMTSLDRAQIEAYAEKYEVVLPKEEKVFWVIVHLMRVGIEDLPAAVRQASRAWLAERGYTALEV